MPKISRLFVTTVVVVGVLLFFFVIRDDFSRYLRIVASGVVFCVCLIGSIYFGMPAAIVAAAANVSGMVVVGKMFAGTHDWYYLSIVVFQATTAVASLCSPIWSAKRGISTNGRR